MAIPHFAATRAQLSLGKADRDSRKTVDICYSYSARQHACRYI